jgi:hypothetical protein
MSAFTVLNLSRSSFVESDFLALSCNTLSSKLPPFSNTLAKDRGGSLSSRFSGLISIFPSALLISGLL